MKRKFRDSVIFFLGAFIMCIASTRICNAEEQEYIEETMIQVVDIEIEGYEQELMVGETLSLTATAVPNDALNARVVYKSSDENIATVKSTGTVYGVTQGNVIIYVTSGDITKELPITVKVKTKAINVNSQFIVLQAGETFELEAKVMPKEADNKLTYKSINEDVATVSENGNIRAYECGTTTIVVSNGYAQASVTVIVNESSTINDSIDDNVGDKRSEKQYPDIININECELVTSDMLKYYYDKKKMLTMIGDKYKIYLSGLDIVNCDNDLNPKLSFHNEQNGISFEIVDRLCGRITLDISDMITDEQYLYIYNSNTNKYQEIRIDDIKRITIDTTGKYLITTEKLSDFELNSVIIVVVTITTIVLILGYVIVKKKYWFW